MNTKGRFGKFGGQYVPEIVMPALNELEAAYAKYKDDPDFQNEFKTYLREYAGRPTNLYYADKLTKYYGRAKIFLKREDLLHTGAHKINNALGQALLAKRMGKKRIVAETGAGQHGVASATVAALFGMECHVFMGALDVERQKLNVFRMKLLGAKVIPVSSGTGTLKDATSEAIRYWATNITDTHYIIGSAVGPHPYPTIVRDFQKVIGEEIREQAIEKIGGLPDYLLACVGGGSNAIGTFYDFRNDPSVKKFGVEAGGRGEAPTDNAKTLSGAGEPGILHGAFSYLLQDPDGQVVEAYSISAGSTTRASDQSIPIIRMKGLSSTSQSRIRRHSMPSSASRRSRASSRRWRARMRLPISTSSCRRRTRMSRSLSRSRAAAIRMYRW